MTQEVETADQMFTLVDQLYPVSYASDKLKEIWRPRYRAVLGQLSADELTRLWHKVGETWTKKSAPSPADLIKLHGAEASGKRAASDPNRRTLAEFRADLAKRDEDRIADYQRIIADYRQSKPKTFAAAEDEGWLSLLNLQVQRSANIICQRNEIRRDGKKVDIMEAHDPKDHRPHFSVTTVGDGDQIEITQSLISAWRELIKDQTPLFKKQMLNKAFAEAGMRSMEITYSDVMTEAGR